MIEETRISELLKPRVKVIADWPGNHTLFVGDILTIYDDGKNAPLFVSSNGDKYGLTFDPKSYPHLFREMQWHEQRKPEEMPEYVKFNEDRNSFLSIGNEEEPEIHKVKRHQATSLLGDFRYSSFDAFVSEWKDQNYSYSQFLPATKTEYDQYIKTKQK